VSQSLRLKDLLVPLTRIKKKKSGPGVLTVLRISSDCLDCLILGSVDLAFEGDILGSLFLYRNALICHAIPGDCLDCRDRLI
jgi:hypothetical protein